MAQRDKSVEVMPLSKPEAAAIRKLRKRSERKVTRRFVIEGVRAVQEAIDANLGMHRVVVSPRLENVHGGPAVRAALERRGVPLAEVPDRTLKTLSDTDSPQGVVVVGLEPDIPLALLNRTRGILAMDGIQDPGNVGTLIRSAHAFGLGGVVALEGTADPWGAKAVRASAGSVFHLPVARSGVTEFMAWCAETGKAPLQLVAAAAGEEATAEVGPLWALVVGSEGRGVRDEILEAADRVVGIPMPGGAESLNAAVAGSLLLYQLKKLDTP